MAQPDCSKCDIKTTVNQFFNPSGGGYGDMWKAIHSKASKKMLITIGGLFAATIFMLALNYLEVKDSNARMMTYMGVPEKK